jgi:hypothetical protein
MDINLCVHYLGLNNNEYRLSQSPIPHEIIEWSGPDPQPTISELESAWSSIEADIDYQAHKDNNTHIYPR